MRHDVSFNSARSFFLLNSSLSPSISFEIGLFLHFHCCHRSTIRSNIKQRHTTSTSRNNTSARDTRRNRHRDRGIKEDDHGRVKERTEKPAKTKISTNFSYHFSQKRCALFQLVPVLDIALTNTTV